MTLFLGCRPSTHHILEEAVGWGLGITRGEAWRDLNPGCSDPLLPGPRSGSVLPPVTKATFCPDRA